MNENNTKYQNKRNKEECSGNDKSNEIYTDNSKQQNRLSKHKQCSKRRQRNETLPQTRTIYPLLKKFRKHLLVDEEERTKNLKIMGAKTLSLFIMKNKNPPYYHEEETWRYYTETKLILYSKNLQRLI